MRDTVQLDELDFALLETLHTDPKIGALELSRRLRVARATVSARVRRLEESGVIAGYEPRLNLAAAGFEVQAFVTMEIVQGALEAITDVLEAIPGVLEAFATTGAGDILCRIAADSHLGLQQTLIELNRSSIVARSARPTVWTRPLRMTTSARRRGMPVPSTTVPPRITRSPPAA